jgi:hypothetical protein
LGVGQFFSLGTEQENQIPPTPFVEGGALMDPSFTKRGWGDLKTPRAICGVTLEIF